ncbi:MAG: hypothetical protein FWF52_10160 [Candidatus Azobacteroides sp.]|nr:hypothetical protein [Candidatus Azobacteroides sp.]
MKKRLLLFTLYKRLPRLSYGRPSQKINDPIAVSYHTTFTQLMLSADLKDEKIQMNNFYGFFAIDLVLVSASLKAKAFKDAKPFIYCRHSDLSLLDLSSNFEFNLHQKDLNIAN